MIDAGTALRIILDSVAPVGRISVALEHATGFVLADPIIAADEIPPFDNSAMDGYAIRAADVRTPPVVLRIVDHIPAGRPSRRALGEGEASAIMTGAPVPDRADAVVPREWTESAGNDGVRVLQPASEGLNIRRAGADVRRGATVLDAGSLLRPQEIGLLASLGKEFVTVYRRPSVAILTTGDELVQINRPLLDGAIRDSNRYLLSSLARESGGEPIMLGTATDERADLESKIGEGLGADMLVTSGGVSVGDRDIVREVLDSLGVGMKFWKVNIKPGMPLLFGTRGSTPVFGLPGNPVSTMVTFLQFVRPALRKMMGRKDTGSSRFLATLTHAVEKSDGKLHYMRGVLERSGGALTVRSSGPQVSNLLSSLTKANCLIIIPADREIIRAGEQVEVELL